jgi:hypothetical protein
MDRKTVMSRAHKSIEQGRIKGIKRYQRKFGAFAVGESAFPFCLSFCAIDCEREKKETAAQVSNKKKSGVETKISLNKRRGPHKSLLTASQSFSSGFSIATFLSASSSCLFDFFLSIFTRTTTAG